MSEQPEVSPSPFITGQFGGGKVTYDGSPAALERATELAQVLADLASNLDPDADASLHDLRKLLGEAWARSMPFAVPERVVMSPRDAAASLQGSLFDPRIVWPRRVLRAYEELRERVRLTCGDSFLLSYSRPQLELILGEETDLGRIVVHPPLADLVYEANQQVRLDAQSGPPGSEQGGVRASLSLSGSGSFSLSVGGTREQPIIEATVAGQPLRILHPRWSVASHSATTFDIDGNQSTFLTVSSPTGEAAGQVRSRLGKRRPKQQKKEEMAACRLLADLLGGISGVRPTVHPIPDGLTDDIMVGALRVQVARINANEYYHELAKHGEAVLTWTSTKLAEGISSTIAKKERHYDPTDAANVALLVDLSYVPFPRQGIDQATAMLRAQGPASVFSGVYIVSRIEGYAVRLR